MSETPAILHAGIRHVAATIYPCMDRRSHRCRRRPLSRVPNKADDRLVCSCPTDRTTSIASNDLRRTPWYDGRGRRGGRRTQALCTITGWLKWLQIKWANVGGRSTRVCATNKENTRADTMMGFNHIATATPKTNAPTAMLMVLDTYKQKFLRPCTCELEKHTP
jgi:hypothetical protein